MLEKMSTSGRVPVYAEREARPRAGVLRAHERRQEPGGRGARDTAATHHQEAVHAGACVRACVGVHARPRVGVHVWVYVCMCVCCV